MNDNDPARTGYTKLYHPRGPLVSLPVVGDTPAAMFAYVTAMLDAGFVVAAPGLEVGEEREMVSGILRSMFEREGEVTDTLLLYAADEGMKYSFLKLYLNDEADVKAFESACGFKLDMLPVYEGKDKPERDGGKIAQKYIAKLPKPAPVIFKQNPKWIKEEAEAAAAKGALYQKPKRLFIRWADAVSTPSHETVAKVEPPPLNDMQVAEAAWKMRLANVIGKDDLNKLIPMVKAITDEAIRKRAWTMCLELADSKKWVVDKAKGIFCDAAEVAPPPVAAAPPPPPPPDEPTVAPLIATWQKKLSGDIVKDFEGTSRDDSLRGLAKLNGDVLTAFRAIPRSEGKNREEVWVMLSEFANKYGCAFDQPSMKFVERMP